MDNTSIMQILQAIIEADKADGCQGCAFVDVKEWEEPCVRCKRNCKDYWRAGEQDG